MHPHWSIPPSLRSELGCCVASQSVKYEWINFQTLFFVNFLIRSVNSCTAENVRYSFLSSKTEKTLTRSDRYYPVYLIAEANDLAEN